MRFLRRRSTPASRLDQPNGRLSGRRAPIDVAPRGSSSHVNGTTEFDLGLAYRIDQVVLPAPSGSVGRSVQLLASNFGRDWHVVTDACATAGEPLALTPQSKVWARHLRITGIDPTDSPAQVFTAATAAGRAQPNKLVISNRIDGLGERLNAMLAARNLATMLGADFAFSWPDDLADSEQHAIRVAEKMFRPEFVKTFHRDTSSLRVRQLKRTHRGRHEVDRTLLRVQALVPAYVGISRLDTKDFHEVDRSPGQGFDSFAFADDLQEAIQAARDIPLPYPVAGLHLRGGDVIVGHWRHVGEYSNKAISIPVARALIQRLEQDGFSVVMFGQEIDVMAELISSTNATRFTDIASSQFEDRTAQTLFELVSLSRSNLIISGRSGFARQAADIAGQPLHTPHDFLTIDEQIDACRNDQKLADGVYQPRQTAFAWWSSFLKSKDNLDSATNATLLRKAAEADPDTSLYDLVAASLLYNRGQAKDADDILARRLMLDTASNPEMPLLELATMARKKGKKRALLTEAMDSIRSAAGESAMARFVIAATKAVDLDIAGAVADIRHDEPELRHSHLGNLDDDLVDLVLELTPRQRNGLADDAHSKTFVDAVQQWRLSSH